MKTVEVRSTSILTPQKTGSLSDGYQYSLNPYAGCAFSCSYCYVPKFPNKRHHDFREWGKWLEVKINAPELLRKERAKVFGSAIFFSSATDPYQYAELKYRLSRKCLEQLHIYKPKKVTLHTRSHLILQDIELLKKFGNKLNVGVSITTDNEEVRKKFEPKAPSIARRIEILKELAANGIETYASIAPLLPSDSSKLVEMISPYTNKIWIEEMNYLEVNTRKELLVEYSSYFEPNAYKNAKNEISSYFQSKIGNASFDSRKFKDRNSQSMTQKSLILEDGATTNSPNSNHQFNSKKVREHQLSISFKHLAK